MTKMNPFEAFLMQQRPLSQSSNAMGMKQLALKNAGMSQPRPTLSPVRSMGIPGGNMLQKMNQQKNLAAQFAPRQPIQQIPEQLVGMQGVAGQPAQQQMQQFRQQGGMANMLAQLRASRGMR